MAEELQRAIISRVRTHDLEGYKCVCERLMHWDDNPVPSVSAAQCEGETRTISRINAVHSIDDSYLLDVRFQLTSNDADFPDSASVPEARTWAYFSPEKNVIAALYKKMSLSIPEIWATLCRESGAYVGQLQPFAVIVRPETVLEVAANAQNSLFSSFLSEIVLPQSLIGECDLNPSTLADLEEMKQQAVVLTGELLAGYKPNFGQRVRARINHADSTENLRKASQRCYALSPIDAFNEQMNGMVLHSIRTDLNNPAQIGNAFQELIKKNEL